MLDILAESPIGVTVKSKRALIESGVYGPNFKLGLAAKDLRLVTAAADAAGLDLRLAPAAQAWFEAGRRRRPRRPRLLGRHRRGAGRPASAPPASAPPA